MRKCLGVCGRSKNQNKGKGRYWKRGYGWVQISRWEGAPSFPIHAVEARAILLAEICDREMRATVYNGVGVVKRHGGLDRDRATPGHGFIFS